ncbi:MAG: SGNH/GDSL hydrolase family protein [Burkholderiales bacterium]
MKPANHLRIAFLGASTTYCAEASSNEATWPHLVTEVLRNSYPNIDYVNAAVPGYGLDSMHGALERRVAPLQPDVIVIYEATNELSSETRELATRQGIYRRYDQTGWLGEHSLLWFLLEKNLKIVQSRREAAENIARLNFEPGELGKSFREGLAALIGDAKRIALVVAVPTFSHQVRAGQTPERKLEAAESALYYMPYMTPELLLAGYARYNEIIREVVRNTGAVSIEGEMEIPGDSVHFNDTVHFKDAGSRAMAARVAKGLLGSPEFQSLLQTKPPAVAHRAG